MKPPIATAEELAQEALNHAYFGETPEHTKNNELLHAVYTVGAAITKRLDEANVHLEFIAGALGADGELQLFRTETREALGEAAGLRRAAEILEARLRRTEPAP